MMQHMKKIRKLNKEKAQKEFALSQLISNKKKSVLQTKKFQQSVLQKDSTENNQAFFIRDLDSNHIHFIDEEVKADRLLSQLSQLPQIDALLEDIWNKYMNAYEKQQEVFLQACYQGQIQMVKKVVSSKNKHPIDAKIAVTDQGKNGIHLATISGSYRNLEIISVLVSCGVDINGVTNNEKRTPLMLGSVLGNDIAIRALLQNQAKIDLQDFEGNTALHLACIYNQEVIVQILLDNQCSLEIKNNHKSTPIDCITNVNIFELVKAKTQTKYGKNYFGESIFRNSRKDHIEKLLQNLKQKQKEETTTMQESIAPRSKIRTKRQQRQEKIKQVMIKEIKEINLSSFKKLSLLGKGAFGEVFLVQNINDEKQYAMKVLDKGMIMRQNILRYAMTERKILSTINHPFVVRLHYAFQTSQKLFLVMQNCPGGDILQLIKKKGKIEESLVRKFTAEIILAIQQLHKAQIIYRDLKAGNVVLDKDGHACLTDFGLSKQAALSHSFCGSTAYLAPEMIWRRGHTKMLDWYLLGVFVYECLTGRPPFWDTNKQQLLANIKTGRYKPLSNEFSKEVRDFVQNLLRANYSKRLGISGVDSLKSHAWFNGTNWKKVMNREQEMAPVEIKQGKPIKQEQFVEPKFIDNKIKGWQFDEKKQQ